MNPVPPANGAGVWDWPTDGTCEVLQEYVKGIPKDKLFNQAEWVDVPFGSRKDDDQGRYALLAS